MNRLDWTCREKIELIRCASVVRILRRTGWNEVHYRRLIDLAFIRIYHNGISYDIDTMIKVAEGNILKYTYENMEKHRDNTRHAVYVLSLIHI